MKFKDFCILATASIVVALALCPIIIPKEVIVDRTIKQRQQQVKELKVEGYIPLDTPTLNTEGSFSKTHKALDNINRNLDTINTDLKESREIAKEIIILLEENGELR